MKQIKGKLALAFDIVDIDHLAFYVNLIITCDQIKKIIKLSQSNYIEKLLDRHNILKVKTIKTLI